MKTKSLALFAILLLTSTGAGAREGSVRLSPDDTARYLAGTLDSEITRTDEYRHHTRETNRLWNKIEATLRLINTWTTENNFSCGPSEPVLYPLSGADIINAFAMYPKAPSYILMALEEPGDMPDIAGLSRENRIAGLKALRSSVWNMSATNYFMSQHMKKEMNNPHIKGTLPVILTFLSRMGFTVTSYKKVWLKEDGGLAAEYDRFEGKNKNHDGYLLRFSVPGETTERVLCYLKMRVEPGMFDKDLPQAKFLKSYKSFSLIMKSAVYLLHNESFSDTARFLNDNASVIIQDDSGIPFKIFDSPNRELILFGRYAGKVKLTDLPNTPYQKNLELAFQKGAKPLPFLFGYGMLHQKSSILVSLKKTASGEVKKFPCR